METIVLMIIYSVCTIVGIVLLFLTVLLRMKARAYKTDPIGHLQGMLLKRNSSRLIKSRTPIYKDPKSGELFTGALEVYEKHRWIKCK